MAQNTDSRIFQSDLDTFLQIANQRSVRLFIREASGTHYSSLYVMLSVQEVSAESTWIYEAFSNFSSDSNGRKKSMDIAHEDLMQVRSKLQMNGFDVQHGEGLGCDNWSPSKIHRTSHYF
ncbi:MAG: hypothetical protein H6577_26690 [Lewinellaceae bacterium]|nr:hypothetical protein [Saprospiraceae bacterium]MCB9341730.1 hypothetical protein [Lewinellaceae bacterium]